MKIDVSDSLFIDVLGLDMLRDLGLRMVDFEDETPEPRTYEVEVPGRSGVIDLTEAFNGDVAYKNGKHVMKFVYAMRPSSDEDDGLVWDEDEWNEFKTRLKRKIHGRVFDYHLSFDRDYTYTGRFHVKFDGTDFVQPYGVVDIEVDRHPYKSKGMVTLAINAAGGVKMTLACGRKAVCPTFEFASETIVQAGGVSARMQAGSYKVNDLWLREGMNEVYLNSYLGDGNVLISEHASSVIADHVDDLISELSWSGIRGAAITVEDWYQDSIVLQRNTVIAEAEHAVSVDTEKYAVYIQYEWADL